jgi:hypothetical protein
MAGAGVMSGIADRVLTDIVMDDFPQVISFVVCVQEPLGNYLAQTRCWIT